MHCPEILDKTGSDTTIFYNVGYESKDNVISS